MKRRNRWITAGLVMLLLLLVGASRARGKGVEARMMLTPVPEASGGRFGPQWTAHTQARSIRSIDASSVPYVGSVLKFVLLLAAFTMAVLPISAGLIAMRVEAAPRRR